MKAKFSRTRINFGWDNDDVKGLLLLDEAAEKNRWLPLLDTCCELYNQGITKCQDTKCDKVHEIWEHMIDRRSMYRKPCKRYLNGYCKAGRKCIRRHHDKMAAYLNGLEQGIDHFAETGLYKIQLSDHLRIYLVNLHPSLQNIILNYVSDVVPEEFDGWGSVKYSSYVHIENYPVRWHEKWNRCGLCLCYDLSNAYAGYFCAKTSKVILLCSRCDVAVDFRLRGYWKGNRPVRMYGRRTDHLYIDYLREKLSTYAQLHTPGLSSGPATTPLIEFFLYNISVSPIMQIEYMI